MPILWLVTLILASGFAITSGRGVKWKVLNVGFIVVCMGLGYGIGYAAGLGSRNLEAVPHAALLSR
jgi:hypothetical protein